MSVACAFVRFSGKPIGPLDTLIGSHALEIDAVLVTHNTREFSRIDGLKLEDWTQRVDCERTCNAV